MKAESSTQLLCLDFDGVICDSMNECMLVAFNAYSGSHFIGVGDLPNEYIQTFHRYRYLVRDPAEYYFLVDAYQRRENPGEARFTQMIHSNPPGYRGFKEKFFSARRALKLADPQAWLALHPPYRGFIDFMARSPVPIDIVTTKDEESVGALLGAYGVTEKVDSVFGQKSLLVCGGKAGAIRKTCAERGVLPSRVAYLDDHLMHLVDVRDTGVRLWYATWGYAKPGAEIPDDIRALCIDSAQLMLGEV